MKRTRRGFTLVELLVVIAIIGILVAILLPAVNSVREAAFRNGCRNNMRQVALAIINYEVQEGKYPIGIQSVQTNVSPSRLFPRDATSDVTAFYSLLPHLEQQAVYATFNDQANTFDPSNAPLIASSIDPYTCPSDTALGRTNQIGESAFSQKVARSNFVLNFGTDTMAPDFEIFETDGPFKCGGSRRSADLADGTTTTILVSEVIAGRVDGDVRGAWAGVYGGSAMYTHLLGPNAGSGDGLPSIFCVESDIIMPCDNSLGLSPHLKQVYHHYAAARSVHAGGGVNVVFADQHVMFISNEVDFNVWQAMATIDGKEQVSMEDL